jgi:hypothetical protein
MICTWCSWPSRSNGIQSYASANINVCNIKRVCHKASLSIPTKGHTDIDIYASIFTVLYRPRSQSGFPIDYTLFWMSIDSNTTLLLIKVEKGRVTVVGKSLIGDLPDACSATHPRFTRRPAAPSWICCDHALVSLLPQHPCDEVLCTAFHILRMEQTMNP